MEPSSANVTPEARPAWKWTLGEADRRSPAAVSISSRRSNGSTAAVVARKAPGAPSYAYCEPSPARGRKSPGSGARAGVRPLRAIPIKTTVNAVSVEVSHEDRGILAV